MLSISLIGDSGTVVSYYEKDDYYATKGEDQAAQGQWYGKTATALGLSGSVDKEQFKDLMEGNLPDGSTLGRWRDGERQHTPGWDLTFSAPKSASLMYELGGDQRVLEAHQKAVKDAVGWLEDSAASTRKNTLPERRVEATGNLAVALFDHDANRNQDPQLHTHAVMLNVTQCDDRFQSMHSKPFFQQKMAGGNVYRASLAQELQKAGYQIEQTHADGRFEISGIDPKILEAFSTRRKDIEADMKARGTEGAEAAEKSALRTRDRKENLDHSVLTDTWKERAQSLGFNAEKHVATAPEQTPSTEPERKHTALASAISRLTEQEAVFTHAKLVGQVLADGMGKLTVEDAERLIRDDCRKGDLFAAQIGEQRAWTTKEADKQERRIHQAISSGQNAVESLLSSEKINLALKDTTLGEGQKKAIELMVGGQDQFVGVLGRPGTGKTFMLDKARELYERQGYTMVGMASNAEAAKQLSESGGVESKTLARYLIDAGKEVHRRKTELTPAQRLEERTETRQVWVVDEASQVNNRDLSRLSSMAKTLGARVVFIGDPQQLGAIEAGKPFTRMLDTGLRHVELDDIRRQSKSEHISAIRSVIAGDVAGAMRTLSKNTLEIADESERIDAIVNQWSKLENRDSALVITSKQTTKNTLNDRMRDVLRQEGKLQDERTTEQLATVFSSRADLKLASTYTVGDTVRFNQDAKRIGVKNGEYLRVAGTDAKTNTVQLENNEGNLTDWDPRKVGTGSQKSVQLYRTQESTVSAGETIVWSRNNAKLGLRNGQQLTVAERDEGWMTVQTKDGDQVKLDLSRPDNCHWEHGYASTVYKSQGKTAPEVLVHAPTEDRGLLSQKAFLVAISRQKDNISIFTDDREKLERNITGNLGDKTSAIEGREEHEAWVAPKEEIATGQAPSHPIPPDQEPPLEAYQDIHLEADQGSPMEAYEEWSSLYPSDQDIPPDQELQTEPPQNISPETNLPPLEAYQNITLEQSSPSIPDQEPPPEIYQDIPLEADQGPPMEAYEESPSLSISDQEPPPEIHQDIPLEADQGPPMEAYEESPSLSIPDQEPPPETYQDIPLEADQGPPMEAYEEWSSLYPSDQGIPPNQPQNAPPEINISVGETIIWSRNNAELGLKNGQRLTVTDRDEGWVSVQTDDGHQAKLDLSRPDHHHWERERDYNGTTSAAADNREKSGSQDLEAHKDTENQKTPPGQDEWSSFFPPVETYQDLALEQDGGR